MTLLPVNNSHLCLTPGDPDGIGPEITLRFLQTHLSKYPQLRLVVIGSLPALEKASRQLGLPLPNTGQIKYIDIPGSLPGEIAYNALLRAVDLIVAGDAKALVTGPIAKSNLKAAGLMASGHTEILDMLAKQHYPDIDSQAEMLFLYKNFRLLLLTRHIPLKEVSLELTLTHVSRTLQILTRFLREDMALSSPRIAMMGVNPHAGEVGGREEADVLVPAMEVFNAQKLARYEGPFAADGLFRGFTLDNNPYDAYVAPYHDQGLIPFKLVAGHHAVNVTIGLPFIRTSVGHGTAFDIAGQGIASEIGLVEAIDAALMLLDCRRTANVLAQG